MPEQFGTQFGRREVRAADSAATGHVQTQGDLNFYNWIGGQPGAPAPHHVLGLALMRKLTAGMNSQQIQQLEGLLNQAGLGMGDKPLNLEGLGQAPGTRGKNTLTGEHYDVHLSEDELIKKLGYSFKKAGTFLYDTPIESIDPQTRMDLILSAAMQIEANKNDVARRHGEKFRKDPNYKANIEKIRQDYADYPPAPGPDPQRTIGSARTVTNPKYLASRSPETAEVMTEANRRQLTTPYTGKQQVPANDATVTPQKAPEIPKPTNRMNLGSRGFTPAPPEPAPTTPANPFRNRLTTYGGPKTRRRTSRSPRAMRNHAGGTDLGAFDGMGPDPTEWVPRGRTVMTGDGPDAIGANPDGSLYLMPTLPIAVP